MIDSKPKNNQVSCATREKVKDDIYGCRVGLKLELESRGHASEGPKMPVLVEQVGSRNKFEINTRLSRSDQERKQPGLSLDLGPMYKELQNRSKRKGLTSV